MKQKKEVKSIVFDLGGVVVPDRSKLIESRIADKLSISKSLIHRLKISFDGQLSKGKKSLTDFFSELILKINSQISKEDLLAFYLNIYEKTSSKQNKKIVDLIKRLKKHHNVSCITNTEIEIARFNEKAGLFNNFHNSFISCKLGMKKPDKAIFEYTLKILGLEPQEIIFIDDKEEFLHTPKKLGLNTILFKNNNQLIKDLKKLGVKIL
ncbi:HAD-IA family hydrolase [Candidatus Pacearchaeota archaeon]|nr:HAD-IA family hydrolase [Candidatus Pacearchaeota archaeon]